MEMVAEAKTLIVEMVCDKCGKGKMIPSGMMLASNPPLYPHVCDKCSYTSNYNMCYPYHKLMPIEPLRKMKESEK